jgi:hypothetical protein
MRNLSEKYFPVIESYYSSGLSAKQFCLEHHLKECTFYYWKKKQRDKNKTSLKGFAPLLIEEKKSEGAVSICYTDGTKLIFESATDVSLFKQLLPVFSK